LHFDHETQTALLLPPLLLLLLPPLLLLLLLPLVLLVLVLQLL